MTRLTIVIPCLGPCEQFEDTLVSVLQNRPERCEIIVCLREAYSDPYHLRGEVSFTHVESSRLVDLINDGVEQARGDIIHLLACGTEVREGWTQPALRHFADPRIAAVAPLVLQRDAPGKMETMGVGYRRGGVRVSLGHDLPIPDHRALKDAVLGPSLQAGFYSREVLLALGGFSREVGDDLADVDLALALRELGCRAVLESRSQIVAAPQDSSRSLLGAISRGWRGERLFWRHWAHEGGMMSLLAHPLTALIDAARHEGALAGGLKLLGRSLALVNFGAARSYSQRLATAAAILGEQELPGETLSLEAARDELGKAASPEPVRRRAA